ncbi:MAG: hypothetical protein A2X49_12800 [Lentisphaerae bacterium GWF2_52_8]|nr:MAG: hypothetical protein A2X49_12800 [Lentisphaerae bacterium GWF2_52_8]
MKIALTFSSKEGLLEEYSRWRPPSSRGDSSAPKDFFAEGDSPDTINAVLKALRSGGHQAIGIEADLHSLPKLSEIKPHLVFNIAEGLYGDCRESYIPMICEKLAIPYTGSGPLSLALCLNKARTKEVLTHYGIPNAPFIVCHPGQGATLKELKKFKYPAIVKPVAEGSSKGIFDDSVVETPAVALRRIKEKLAKYEQAVILEEFLPGMEMTVPMIGNGSKLEVLPIVAMNYGTLPKGARHIYSYEAKWIWDTAEKPLEIFQCPAKLSARDKKKVEGLVRRTFEVLGLRDWARIDVRFDARGEPNILEVNPLPGILPKPEDNSCFPKGARAAGYSYEEMINKVVDTAILRYGLKKGK